MFGQGGFLIGLGVALGVVGAIALTRLYLATLLYNVSATDVTTFIAAPIMLAAIAALAIYVPARRPRCEWIRCRRFATISASGPRTRAHSLSRT